MMLEYVGGRYWNVGSFGVQLVWVIGGVGMWVVGDVGMCVVGDVGMWVV